MSWEDTRVVRLPSVSLARQLLLLQLAVAALVIAVGVALAYVDARRDSLVLARAQVLSVAEAVAQQPTVQNALTAPDPAPLLQPLAESVQRATGVDFVVVMSPDRIRYSHPDLEMLGGTFQGNLGTARTGEPFLERFTGTLGPSVRAVVRVPDEDPLLGYVAVGITETRIADTLFDQLPALLGVTVLALALAAAGSALVSGRLHRLTHGLGPAEMTRMYEHHDAVLHAVREGLLVLDRDRRIVLINDEGGRLLGVAGAPHAVEGLGVRELGLPDALSNVLADGRSAVDELHLAPAAVVVVNQATASRSGRVLGTVTTLRDQSALQALSNELSSVRGFAEALRAQAHESANRLHTVVTMIELGHADDAVEFATAELASAQELTDRILAAVEEPVLAALLLGKAAEAHERGVELVVSDETALRAGPVPAIDLVTIVGNLVDNAVDAVLAADPPRQVSVLVRSDQHELVVRVRDTGTGIPDEQIADVFRRGWSSKSSGDLHGRGLGLALVRATVDRHGGSIEVRRGDSDTAAPPAGAVLTVRLPLPAATPA